MRTHGRPGPSKSLIFSFAAGIGLCIWLTACSSPRSQNEPPPQQAQQTQQAKRYDMKGKIVSIDREKMQITVDHGAIPGFMGAMTMPYPVKAAGSLDGLAAGNQITAQVVVSGDSVWLENIVAAK